MIKNMVITASGPDQVGIVERVTKVLIEYGANVEESRMAKLGGEFALLLLISIPEEKIEALQKAMEKLKAIPLVISHKLTVETRELTGYVPYDIMVTGADHEGIIHPIAEFLARKQINIETLDSATINAPGTGTPLFTMYMRVQAPLQISLPELRKELIHIGEKMGTDIEVQMPIK